MLVKTATILGILIVALFGDPPSLKSALVRANRLVEKTTSLADVEEQKIFDGEFQTAVAIEKIDTENDDFIVMNGKLRVYDEPNAKYYFEAEIETIKEINDGYSAAMQNIAESTATKKGEAMESARKHRDKRLKPYIDAAKERKEYYEFVAVKISVARRATKIEDLAKKKQWSVIISVDRVEMLEEKFWLPLGRLAERRDPKSGLLAIPKVGPRIGLVEATFVRASK